MSYIVVTRNPSGGGLVIINKSSEELDDLTEVAEFETSESAEKMANNQILCKAWGYEVVEVDV